MVYDTGKTTDLIVGFYESLIIADITLESLKPLMMMFKAEVSGTAMIIPIVPHTHPQKINDIRTTIGDRFNSFPNRFGSMILPKVI